MPDLPVCMDQRNNAQCCSSSYITDRLGITEEDFLAGLRAELEDRFDDFDDLVERLRACKFLSLSPTFSFSLAPS